jgi:hypothetical protein
MKLKLPHRRRFLHLAAGAAALPAVSRIAGAQSYPTRPVRIIVAIAAGGSQDTVARLITMADRAPRAEIHHRKSAGCRQQSRH